MNSPEESPLDDPPLTQQEEVNAALLRQWLKGGWECNDSDLVDDHFHPDCIVSGLTPDVLEGIEEFRAAHRAICGGIEHREARMQSLMMRGNCFAATLEFEGKHCDTGLDVAFEVACYGRMKDGLVYRIHNVIDYTGLYAKLGILDVQKLAEFFG